MRRYVMILSALVLLFIGLPESKASAAIADGTHSLNFQVNKPDSSSTSLANDYFAKPAKLIVSNGSMKVQMTIKNSSWVTEFNPPGGATVISTNPNADSRVVQFPISNVGTVKIGMKIDIDDIDYHHSYTVDFVFDGSGLPEKQEQPATPPPSTNNSGANTSSPPPVATEKPAAPSNSSGAVNSNAASSSSSNASNTATKTENKETTESEEIAEEATPATTNEEANPETSDSLPLVAMLIFVAAFAVLFGTKKRQTT